MDKKYYLGFSLFPGIGPAIFKKLINKFGNAKDAWESSATDIESILGKPLAEKFLAFKKTTNLVEEYEKCVQKNIQLVTLEDKEYPSLLKELRITKQTPRNDEDNYLRSHLISNKIPYLLYVKGDVSALSSPNTIGIVGTRKITDYGKQVTEMMTSGLVESGYTTVSGLAFGVDATVHMVTVRNNGKTVAILGCGVDCCTPRENQRIYDSILASGGAIISTFPPGMEATKGSFPARNAIIAGLSQGILVTEGATDSGALITADYAKKFGRPVFAVPGPITSNLSKGTNSLLKNGAVAVTTAADILDTLGIMVHQKTQKTQHVRLSDISDNPDEQSILSILEIGPLHFNEIVRRINKDSKSIGSLLSLLELKGLVKSDGSWYRIV